MIILNDRKFIGAPFTSEEEIERVVSDNSEYIFGPNSIFLPKKLILSPEGIGTIPDGFVVDLANKQWFVIEAELSSHSVWSHIAPQVSKQITAAMRPSTHALLTELVVNRVKADESLQEMFADLGIEDIDIRHVLTEIFQTKPVVGIPIDSIGPDLREWAQTLKTDVKLWIVRKLVEFDNPANILYEIPDEFKPVFDTTKEERKGNFAYTTDDITLADLLEHHVLSTGDVLHFPYKPRQGDKTNFDAQLSTDGTLLVMGKEFPSPSYAAVYCMQSVGSKRRTINGWLAWRDRTGAPILDLREKLVIALNAMK
jgi:hypothetical protein